MIDFASLSLAAVSLASALLVWPGPCVARLRLASVGAMVPSVRPGREPSIRAPWSSVVPAISIGLLLAALFDWLDGVLVGLPVAVAAWWAARRRARALRTVPADPLRLAASWDLLAACLRAGLPVPAGIRAIADQLPQGAANALRATADLLALGADPVEAWAPALRHPDTAGLARGARRTARSGAALAGVAITLARAVRTSSSDAAEARAQRAGVLISAPLGICFLPAFVCLGIAPVVMGIAAGLDLVR